MINNYKKYLVMMIVDQLAKLQISTLTYMMTPKNV